MRLDKLTIIVIDILFYCWVLFILANYLLMLWNRA